MWTCGICCQLAVMFPTTAARRRSSRVGRGSVAARRRPGGDVTRDDAPAGARPLQGRQLDPSLAGEAASRRGRDRALAAAARGRQPAAGADDGACRVDGCRREGSVTVRRTGGAAGSSSASTPVDGHDRAFPGDDPEDGRPPAPRSRRSPCRSPPRRRAVPPRPRRRPPRASGSPSPPPWRWRAAARVTAVMRRGARRPQRRRRRAG